MPQTPTPFSHLVRYMQPFRRAYLSAMLFSFLKKIFDLIPGVLVGMAINTIVKGKESWLAGLGFIELKVQLLFIGLLCLIAYSLESLFQYLSSIKWWRLAQQVQHKLRMDAFEHVEQSTMAAFSAHKTGNLLAILNDDINQLERFLEEGLHKVIEIITSVLLVGSIFFFLSPKLALFTIAPIPLVVYGTYFFQKKLDPLYLMVREKSGALSTRLANSLLGLFTTKSLVAEALEVEKFEKVSEAYKKANYHAINWGALVVPVIRFAILMGYLVTLIYGGFLTLEGRLDVGAYTTLTALSHQLLWPFMDLGEAIINFQRVMAAMSRLLGIFEMPLETSPTASHSLAGKITFEEVSFTYGPDRPTIRKLAFTIEPGKTVAFVGATGAGKSTLLKLLLGFYTPTQGQILFDEHELRTLSLAGLRRQIGFVGQESFLFEGTIAENIAYAFPSANREQTIQAAKGAAAHEFIMRMPQGYDTWIGERGTSLSGGQKQRLAIARALVRNPAILILDEATSAVDNETEFAIQQSLAEFSQNRTTILIAHRLSTVRQADQIFVLHHGEIAEQGTHEELLQQDRLYANLWKLQTGEAVTDAALLV
ncbi:MAG: ABC transporter ATP-binding protein [Bacteroidota bacterium]